jgi:hypothetical protein
LAIVGIGGKLARRDILSVAMNPIAQASELFAQPFGRGLRLIGGLGIQSFVGAHARVTHDVDVVAVDLDTAAKLRSYLEAQGFKIGEAGAYFRARKAGAPAIDVFMDPVANPRTFEAMKLSEAPVERRLGGTSVWVAGPHDVALLKLCAGRDQDAIDLALLASAVSLVPRKIVSAAEASDVEVRVSEGGHRFRNLVARNAIDEVADELLGRALSMSELDAFRSLLEGLGKEGC